MSMTPAQLSANAADLRLLAKRLRMLADETEGLLDKTSVYDSSDTWSGPYSDRASQQLVQWVGGLSGTATQMRDTANDWDSAASGMEAQAKAAAPKPAKAGA